MSDTNASETDLQIEKDPETGEELLNGEPFNAERAMATIRNLRQFEREAETLKKKLEALEEEDRKRKEAELSEAERARAEAERAKAKAESLEQQLRTTRLRHAVELKASEMGFHSPQAAYALADLSDAEIGEDGTAKGIDKALNALAKSDPYLVKEETGSGSGGTVGRTDRTAHGTRLRKEADEEARDQQMRSMKSRGRYNL